MNNLLAVAALIVAAPVFAEVNVGDPAPDFTLPGTGNRSYSLSEFRGQPVVLVFFRGVW